MIGTTLSHYRITAKLGEGGMGEVYRAHDEKLGRDVAIKVLPQAWAEHPDRLARFDREAKAVARLSHPNILDIHELGEHHGRPFIVTELLEGETLRERLESTSLGWRKAAEIGAAIADGVNAAHRAGIVHRDLKPSNIFLTADGRVKVLDFGLARSVEADGDDESRSPTVSNYTDPGSVLGTVGYMSPEQVRGEPAGQLSDIFSLGCVLYEMVCGRRAFSGDTAVETMNAILKEEPSDLRSLTGGLAPSMASIVRHCLEKRPESRFQTGQDLSFALRAALQDDSEAVARATSEEKSIVVLPFENLSPAPDQDYFADGLTEEIISDLAGIRSTRVISRTSAMRLKGTDKDLRTIGRDLNVRYVLEGSVRRAGNNLRITAQLIDAVTDSHLWSEKYKGTLDDVFDIQEKVSRSIVDALEVELTPQEDQGIAAHSMNDIQAYELCLRTRRDIVGITESGLLRAIRDLENALELMGENPEFFFLLGLAYLHCQEFGIDVEGSAIKRAEEAINYLMRFEPDSSRVHNLLGRIERFRGNGMEGLRHLERAVSIDPDDSDTLFLLAVAHTSHTGHWELAVRLAERAVTIDPLSPVSYFALGIVRWIKGDLDHAIQAWDRATNLEPDNYLIRAFTQFVLLIKGEFHRAFNRIDEITRLPKTDWYRIFASEFLQFSRFAVEKKPDQALAVLGDEVRAYLWNDPDLPGTVAGIFSLMGEKDEALRWLEHAIDKGSINYPLFAERDPFLGDLRSDDRFKKLMATIKPKWEQFEPDFDISKLSKASDDR
jgi:serine/threonine protein kinase/tetratricopeptide (TPR) repeat protein